MGESVGRGEIVRESNIGWIMIPTNFICSWHSHLDCEIAYKLAYSTHMRIAGGDSASSTSRGLCDMNEVTLPP